MNGEEILSKLSKIEIREGKERQIKSYVHRNNVLSDKEKAVVLKYFDKYGFFFEDEKIDYRKLFGNDRPVIIEIGFGMGDSTREIAIRRPEYNYIGIEVFLTGFVRLLKGLGDDGLENVRIIRFNAVDVIEHMIAENSVAGFHVFFPDPWPKKKHHKRRLMSPEFMSLLESRLVPGGYIYMVTDWEEYAEETLEKAKEVEGLSNPFYSFAPPVAWRPVTKFEQKGMEKEYTISEIWLEKH